MEPTTCLLHALDFGATPSSWNRPSALPSCVEGFGWLVGWLVVSNQGVLFHVCGSALRVKIFCSNIRRVKL